MNSRTIRFEGNELYEVIQQVVGTFPAGDRAAIAYEALKKFNAVGSPFKKIGRFQVMTLPKENGPKEVVLLEAERDVAVDALKAWDPPAFDYPLKTEALSLLLNAKSD